MNEVCSDELCVGCECEKIEQMIRHAFWSSGMEKIVIGLSGGIDSSLAAVLCSRAVGSVNVLGYLLPSSVTPEADMDDVKALCDKFEISYLVVPITGILEEYESIPGYTESPYLKGNLMARIRMTTLYYFANQQKALVCGTSNKSEYYLGYSTKHGDDAADIQPLLHLLKKEVYILAGYLEVPDSIINKTPSAGRYPGQSDEEEIGFSYEEIDKALENLISNGFKPENETETAILKKVEKASHKRCAPPNLLKEN